QRNRIDALAVIGVDKVQAVVSVTNAGFPGPGPADFDFLRDQNFGPAGFIKADGMRHGISPQSGMTRVRRAAARATICAEWAARNTLRRHPDRLDEPITRWKRREPSSGQERSSDNPKGVPHAGSSGQEQLDQRQDA